MGEIIALMTTLLNLVASLPLDSISCGLAQHPLALEGAFRIADAIAPLAVYTDGQLTHPYSTQVSPKWLYLSLFSLGYFLSAEENLNQCPRGNNKNTTISEGF